MQDRGLGDLREMIIELWKTQMPVEKETKDKVLDGALVAAKITGMMSVNLLALTIGGRWHAAIIPRPINMWKNQRRTRAFRDALEEAGVPIDFGAKVTFKNKEPKVCSLTWASLNVGCDKWEMCYYLVKNGTVQYGDTRIDIVR